MQELKKADGLSESEVREQSAIGEQSGEEKVDVDDVVTAIIESVVDAVEKVGASVIEKIESSFAANLEQMKLSLASGNAAEVTAKLKGAVTGETGRETPDKRVDFSKLSYAELCSFLENHPKANLI